MENFDDIFTSAKPQRSTQYTPDDAFNKDAWAASKQAERSEVYGMMDAATESVLSNGTDFRHYLDTLSKFDRYSAGNVLLILTQMPEATQLRDFDGWKEKNANIKKNEKGIRILEPGDEYTREDGTSGVSYNVKKVFDISQTTARREQQRERPNARQVIRALMQASPVTVNITEGLPPDIGAHYDPNNGVINIRKGMSAQDIVHALSQEIAHAEMDGQDGKYDRGSAAFTAYCASYVISQKTGFDVSQFNFDRLPESYSGMEPQAGRSELTRIRNVSADILENMNAKLEQQRDKARHQPER
jgi:hypothetical protein